MPGSGLSFPSARVGALISLGEPLFTQVQAGVHVNTHTHTHTHTHACCLCSMLYKRSQGCLHVAFFTLTPTAPWGRRDTLRPVLPTPKAGSCRARRSHTMDFLASLWSPPGSPSPLFEPQPRVRRHLILPSLVLLPTSCGSVWTPLQLRQGESPKTTLRGNSRD